MTTTMTAVVAASFSYSDLYLQVNSANTSCFSVIMCVILSLAVYTMKKKKVCYYHSVTQYTPQAVTGITPMQNLTPTYY